LDQAAVIAHQQPNFPRGDLLIPIAWENTREGKVPEIEYFNEVSRVTDPTVLQFRHGYGPLSSERIVITFALA
jgi:hypothetical protein